MRITMACLVLVLGACDGSACTFNSECPAGSHCAMGACASECSASMPCPGAQACDSFGRCVGSADAGADAGSRPPDAGPADAGPDPDAGSDGGTDAGTDAGPPEEACTPSSAGSIASDEDGDGAIDEGCEWHFGVPHPVIRAHVRSGEHYFPRLADEGRRVYFGAPGASGLFVPHFVERTDRSAPFMAPSEVPGAWGPAHVYDITLREDQLEAFVQTVHTGTRQYVFRATRASLTAPFGPLERVEASVIGASESRHPFITPDGLELFFNVYSSGPDGRLYRARRADVSSAFGAAEPLTLPGTADGVAEESPSLAGRDLFFTRYDGTSYRSFRATRASADGVVFTDAVELTAIGPSLAPAYSPETRELWFDADPVTAWSPTGWSMWRVEVCRDGPCPTRAIDCPPPGVRRPDGLGCYTRPAGSLSWSAAEAACVTAGGHLASLHSEAERALVWGAFSTTYLWIGGTDEGSEGVFRWSSGEPWISTPWGFYPPTGALQPDNSSGAEHCLDLLNVIVREAGSTESGFVNDEACAAEHEYVCERELWPVW